jgi:hypothetical protein
MDPITNQPVIAFYDATSTDPYLARRAFSGTVGDCGPGNSWKCYTQATAEDVGQYLSLALDSQGLDKVVAFVQGSHQNRLLFENMDESYKLDDGSPDIGDWIGYNNSLKFDLNDNWWVSYYRMLPSPSNQLRVAHYVGVGNGNCGDWNFAQCEVIETGTAVGYYSSLSVRGDNAAFVAYRGAGGVLKLAYKSSTPTGNCGPGGNTWVCLTIDSSANVGNWISLDMADCTGAHCLESDQIAYYDLTHQTLKYAKYVGSNGNCGPGNSWRCDVIDSIGYSGLAMGVSRAVDNDSPTIAYLDENDSANTVLKIARPVIGAGNCGPSNTWRCTTIDNGARPGSSPHSVGAYASLGIDPVTHFASIAYYDATAGDLELIEERLLSFLPAVVK